jgi:hypothetical protein
MRLTRTLALAAAVLLVAPAYAHRLSPAFFGLTETGPDVYDVQWKVSISGGLAAALEPKVPEGCSLTEDVRTYVVNDDVRFQHTTMSCPGGVGGRVFAMDGLSQTQTDVLLRVDYLDGTSSNERLTPSSASVVIPKRPSSLEVIRTYTVLGVEHILLGIDHLLFVLALLLLVRGVGRLVATVTAFTVAHSITLGAGDARVRARAIGAGRGGDRAQHPVPRFRARTSQARAGEGRGAAETTRGSDRALPLDRRVLVRVAARLWLRGRAERGWHAGAGRAARSVVLQRRRRDRPALVYRGRVRDWLAHSQRRRAAPDWWPRAAAYGIGSVAAFWVVERTLAIF